MRGAQFFNEPRKYLDRIIPADAGSTIIEIFYSRLRGDHPRGCGEHVQRLLCQPGQLGSSPRMRGAHDPVVLAAGLFGIIPADAGSTCRSTPGCPPH